MTEIKRPKIYHSASVKNDVDSIRTAFINILEQVIGKDEYTATTLDIFKTLAYLTKAKMMKKWIKTQQYYHLKNKKRVYYLSLEFLIGRLLQDSILNLGIEDNIKEALHSMKIDYNKILEAEPDAGLGNGGLGRLAACFLDSMATLGVPSHGYGIRYQYGIFNQTIESGRQLEKPDNWLKNGNPWEVERNQFSVRVKFYGRTIHIVDDSGTNRAKWVDTQDIIAMPYDTPVPGYGNDIVNTLRLWTSRALDEFNLEYFNEGDYLKSCEKMITSENISKILYPNDSMSAGKELRLKQQYFFVSASIQDIIRRFFSQNKDIKRFPDKVVIQINDTHPAIAIPELLRILMDENSLSWEDSWRIVTNTFAYSNHTLMPEALEKWPVGMLTNILPRVMEIIYDINHYFLSIVREKFPNDDQLIKRISIIEEGPTKMVRMAYLASVVSFSINGVSKLHTRLLKENLLKDFYMIFPKKFNNKTNGITPRRWLYTINEPLSTLIEKTIGNKWVTNLEELKKLAKFSDNADFINKWSEIKKTNKEKLAKYIFDENGIKVNTNSIFDIHAKRIHEYKRQLLCVLNAIYIYNQIRKNPKQDITPRVIIFSGKAAPGYKFAKLIIKFINDVADTINNDPLAEGKLNILFLKDYNVSLASKLVPACDLSEQISTAGYEASGTGNMKFALNGALTIGTLDGANVEIMEEVGKDNIFIFGLTVEEVKKVCNEGYDPYSYYNSIPELQEIVEMIKNDFFSKNDPGIYQPIVDKLLSTNDSYLHFADFLSYIKTQEEISKLYKDNFKWAQKSILNVANVGIFSADRTIKEYSEDIWKISTLSKLD